MEINYRKSYKPDKGTMEPNNDLVSLLTGGISLERLAFNGLSAYALDFAGKMQKGKNDMSKKDGMSKNRNVQQKQIDSINKELRKRGIDPKKHKREIHDLLHGQNFNYKEALKEVLDFFGIK